MKQPFKSIMRVLFLLSALLGAASAATAFTCDHECVFKIYTKIAEAEASGGGYKEGDMAVYGYILYHAYTVGADAGFAWVDGALTNIGTGCAAADFDPSTRKGMADCFAAATQDDIDGYEEVVKALSTEEKAGYDWIVGAIANQLAPGSAFAEEYPGVSAADFEQALGVYYIVGAVFAVFEVIETPGVFADQAAKDACYTAAGEAVEYDPVAGGNLVELLIKNADKLEAAFKGDKCFGDAAVAAELEKDAFKDELAVTTGVADSVTAAEANVAKFKDSQPTADEPTDDESAAAALSAVVALLAMML